MRVAVVVPGGVDRSGTRAVIPCLLWMLDRLAERHDVQVFAMRGDPEPGRWELCGAVVHNVGEGSWVTSSTLRTVSAVVGEHRRRSFDLVHAFWASGPGVVAAVAGRLLRLPVLLHVTGGDMVGLPEIGYGGRLTARGRLLVGLALRAAEMRTADTRPVLDALEESGHPGERLPMGVDLRIWPPAPPRPRDRERSARLVHVASLNRVKDQPTLLEAFARLLEAGWDATLDVIGEDTLGGDAERLAAELDLRDRVRFHGFLTQERLRPLVREADLLVLSSRHESGPIVALEAASQGVPTVGTDVGRLREWAPDAASTVPVGDADALARAVMELLEDDDRRVRLAEAAQRRALSEDAEWSADRVSELYARLAGERTLA